MTHTVEKIGGTSMSRVNELVDTLFTGGRKADDLYGRVFGPFGIPRKANALV